MSLIDYDEFMAIVGHIERHTGDGSCPHAAAAKLVPCLRIIGRGKADPAWRELRNQETGAAPTWAEVREACQQNLKLASAWVGGAPDHVAAAIDDIAAMDLRHRNERRAALTAAWADHLTAYESPMPRATDPRPPHPGRTSAERRALDAIGCGGPPRCSPKTLRALLDAGMIMDVGTETRCDALGSYRIPAYAMPIPVHMTWCEAVAFTDQEMAEFEAEMEAQA